MQTIYVKPAGDGLVRNPDRAMAQMPAAGDFVPASLYWHRRLKAGDVVPAEPPAETVPQERPVDGDAEAGDA